MNMKNGRVTVAMRQTNGKGGARKLRAAGLIPAVIYGEGETGRPVEVQQHDFSTLMRSGAHHGILDIEFTGEHEPIKALIRELQVHPVSRQVLHIDLQKVNMQKPIRVKVPINLVGKPEGVRNQGGILEHNLRDIEIECLPGEIPSEIEMDVTDMLVGQSLHVSDLVREGVTVLGHADTAVATISLPPAERSADDEATDEAAATTEEGTAEAGEQKDEAGAKEGKS